MGTRLDTMLHFYIAWHACCIHTIVPYPLLSPSLLIVTFTPDAVAGYYEYYAGLAYSWEGEIIQSDNVGENIYLHYAPVG